MPARAKTLRIHFSSVREFLTERIWRPGWSGWDRDGEKTYAEDPDAVAWDLLGAVWCVYKTPQEREQILGRILRHLGLACRDELYQWEERASWAQVQALLETLDI